MQIKLHRIEDPQLDSYPSFFLPGETIHVWQAFVPHFEGRLEELEIILSRDERLKAERFFFEKDRALFVVAHGVLRKLLGRYLDILPDHVVFEKGPNGKPEIVGLSRPATLWFNISHSHELAVFAFSKQYGIGVDVERIRSLPDFLSIAQGYFHPEEVDSLIKTPDGKKCDLFYECWTKKEAFVKGTGEGLSRPLDSFAVSLGVGDGLGEIRIFGGKGKNKNWSVLSFKPIRGYAGAIAVRQLTKK
ncbi:MAG: 4'-phosphopantetheinyl transferase superfamily protein [Desulfobacteraceae bacterium]|nr:4'-phosphopantetheinyl transferase superfamily protein [Desulfobacteraceae bacterium]